MKREAAFARLQEKVDQIPDLEGLFLIDLIRSRDASDVFSGAWGERLVLVKHFLGPDGPAEAEAAHVESVNRAGVMNTTPLQVAEPLLLAKEQGIFVSQFIEGETLFDLLATGRDAEPLYSDAGRWFAAYTQDRQRRNEFKSKRWLDRAKAWPPRGDGRDQLMLKRLSQLAKLVDGVSIRQARVHGDFTTSNLIKTDTAIVGIDIANRAFLAVCKDLARFLAQGEAFQDITGGVTKTGLPKTRTKALLDGYGELEPIEADALFPFFYGWELLQFSRHAKTDANAKNYARAMDAFLSVS